MRLLREGEFDVMRQCYRKNILLYDEYFINISHLTIKLKSSVYIHTMWFNF